eukprot:SAG22_NODE_2_length_61565_cov_858.782010_69_plen_176_part_00
MLQLFILSIVLIVGVYVVATIVITSRREQLVTSMGNTLSPTDLRYFAASLESLAEILIRIILPAIPFLVIGIILLGFLVSSRDISITLILLSAAKALLIIVPLLVAVAYLTLLERKVMASMQRRKGPNVVGLYGLLQPLCDGLKLFLKETILPTSAHKVIFVLAPIMTFFLAVCG